MCYHIKYLSTLQSVGTLSVPAAATPTDISPYILAVLFLGHMIGFVEYTIGTGVSCGIFTMSLTDGNYQA